MDKRGSSLLHASRSPSYTAVDCAKSESRVTPSKVYTSHRAGRTKRVVATQLGLHARACLTLTTNTYLARQSASHVASILWVHTLSRSWFACTEAGDNQLTIVR